MHLSTILVGVCWKSHPVNIHVWLIISEHMYEKTGDGNDWWKGYYWGQGTKLYAKALTCYKVMGDANIIFDTVVNTPGDVIMVARFESLTHVTFTGKAYWTARARLASGSLFQLNSALKFLQFEVCS